MIYPMYAMVVLTVLVALLMMRGRFMAVRGRHVPRKYFASMNGTAEIPDFAQLPARHWLNLFELPILFYAACLTALYIQAAGPTMQALAWTFVVARYVQAFVHLTYNNVIHRMIVFAIGLIAVFAMWTLMVFAL